MFQKEIYIVRHGETDYNLRGMVQGSGIDAPLNSTGQAQAALFYEGYADADFDRVYTSCLQRTRQSVHGFIRDGIPHEAHSGLNEICWGFHEGKVASSLDKAYYSDLMHNWRTGNTHVQVRGGESPDEVVARQLPVIDLWRNRTDEDRILVCMHGRAMRILLSTMLETPLAEMDQYPHQNLGLYILGMREDGSFALLKQNCGKHLEEAIAMRA